jgi:hypothetical protein
MKKGLFKSGSHKMEDGKTLVITYKVLQLNNTRELRSVCPGRRDT